MSINIFVKIMPRSFVSFRLIALLMLGVLFTGCSAGGSSTASTGTTTVTPAVTPTVTPTVTNKIPAAAATGVSLSSSVNLTFSTAMKTTTITTASFTLKQGGTIVAGTISHNTGNIETFIPNSNLLYNTVYTVSVSNGITDLANNALAAASWNFTTVPAATFNVGGALVGLAANATIVLQNNAKDNLSLTANGGFTFATKLKAGVPYAITILTQPAGKICTVSNGNGTMSAVAMANVTVICAPAKRQAGGIVGIPLTLQKVVSTLAGGAGITGSTNAIGTASRFNKAYGITTDGTSLFITDTVNQLIRKVIIATGTTTTIAGSTGIKGRADGTGTAARFNNPQGITTDGVNLFIADSGNHSIRQVVIATGVVSTLVGSTTGLFGLVDGVGTAVRFQGPEGITTDGTNLFVTDTLNNVIRKVVIATKTVSVLAGSLAKLSGIANGVGTAVTFNKPRGITTDGTNLFVVDTSNNSIRKIIIATATVSVLAGYNGVGIANTPTTTGVNRFRFPCGITTDGTNLFMTDTGNNNIRQIIIATGAVSLVAGSPGAGAVIGTANGVGTAARFNIPNGITTDGTSLFVVDNFNSTIRQVK
ncbi:MAG: Ig-like domain-containing protein [Mariprofundaceae bacterium]|nr:Ig-like domain-containing protein [Mariprofundaceae bacterium]